MKNCINVCQKNNLFIIKINSNAKYEEIIRETKKKVEQLKKIYKEDKIPITVTGKVLKNFQMDEIEEIIKQELDVDVEFDMPRELGLSNIRRTFNEKLITSETMFHRGSLRSGQKIEDEGSIVIIGDVNPGAQVIAGDNIIIVGALRGLAHAGAKGNRNAIIAAGKLDTVQIRIANIVREIDKNETTARNQTYIYIDDEQNKIIIE